MSFHVIFAFRHPSPEIPGRSLEKSEKPFRRRADYSASVAAATLDAAGIDRCNEIQKSHTESATT
jgi:hypothetical protein